MQNKLIIFVQIKFEITNESLFQWKLHIIIDFVKIIWIQVNELILECADTQEFEIIVFPFLTSSKYLIFDRRNILVLNFWE
jgi:hypothetical protein